MAEQEAANTVAVTQVAKLSPLVVGIDIDGTLDANPAATAFFRLLTAALRANGHRIMILSHRPFYRELAEQQLNEWGIVFDHLVWADARADKAEWCRKLAIDLFFDDSDECIVGIDERTLVLKVRNKFNFDFEKKIWGYTEDASLD
jgi:uncharacterized HAD superfamily protein